MFYIRLFIIVIIVSFTQVLSADQLTNEECLEMGFRKSELSCLRCEEFPKFDLNALKKSCLQCCLKDLNENSKKYSSARLEFCGCPTHATNFPQTNAFIKSDKTKKFPNLTIKTVKGSDPVIKLMDSNGVVVEELNINKWDTDTIEDFLSQRLLNKKN